MVTQIKNSRIARRCAICGISFLRKFWRAVICPCCHMHLKEHIREAKKKRRYVSPEARKHKSEYNKQYRLAHKGKSKEYHRQWYATHVKLKREEVNCPILT